MRYIFQSREILASFPGHHPASRHLLYRIASNRKLGEGLGTRLGRSISRNQLLHRRYCSKRRMTTSTLHRRHQTASSGWSCWGVRQNFLFTALRPTKHKLPEGKRFLFESKILSNQEDMVLRKSCFDIPRQSVSQIVHSMCMVHIAQEMF